MSDDEVEEIGHSMTVNDKLRLFGMRGDDEEDLLGMLRLSLAALQQRRSWARRAPPVRLLLLPARPLLPPPVVVPSSLLLTALLPLLAGTISRSSSK
jgi:hypothetical protein